MGGIVRLNVDHISETGETISVALDDRWARDAAIRAIDAEPVALDIRLELMAKDRFVRVGGRARVSFAGTCDRCGEPVDVALDTDVDLVYAPVGLDAEHIDEAELMVTDLEVGWYEAGAIALDDVISEALALALPSRIVCIDVVACETRTRVLLEASGDNPAGHPAFAALQGTLES